MPRKNRQEGKKKWIVGGIISFAAVTLVATGFATYIVGVDTTEQTPSLGIAVDTAQNASVTLTATVGTVESITVSEVESVSSETPITTMVNPSGSYTTDYVRVDGTAPVADMKFSFDTLSFTCGPDYLTGKSKIDIQVSLKTWKTGAPDSEVIPDGDVSNNNNLTDDADLINMRDGTAYTYIDISKTITIWTATTGDDDKLEVTATGNYSYTGSTDEKEVTVAWGTFFNNKSPYHFYNEMFNAQNSESNYLAPNDSNFQLVTNELNAMHEAFNPQGTASPKITVLVEVVTYAA